MRNKFTQLLFRIPRDDISNASKMYRRTVIAGVQPLLAQHFNLTVELPLKPIVRGYRYAIVPNTWINRNQGVSKFKIKEMGSRYFSSCSIGSSKRLWARRSADIHAVARDAAPGVAPLRPE